jgi:hypothetical protein
MALRLRGTMTKIETLNKLLKYLEQFEEPDYLEIGLLPPNGGWAMRQIINVRALEPYGIPVASETAWQNAKSNCRNIDMIIGWPSRLPQELNNLFLQLDNSLYAVTNTNHIEYL